MPAPSVVPPAWRILRPANAAVAAVGVVVGAFLVDGAALSEPSHAARAAFAAFAAFAFAGAGNVRNDLGDVTVDRVAHPDRPLVSGAFSVGAARALVVVLYAAALVIGVALGWGAFAVVVVGFVLMESYERWLKAEGFPGNLAIGLLTGAPFVLGAVVEGFVPPSVIALTALATLATLGREVLKDVEDVAGDVGRRTLPQRVGVTRARAVAACALVAAVVLSPLPWVSEKLLGWSYLLVVAVADAGFLASAFAPIGVDRAQRLAKLSMIVALAAFLLGRAEKVWTA